ncbi:MAG: L,D-transpeptidase [Chlamydiae bacterium]|nr:L,D-transpeptidase [Chlamydiota bacterium]
MSFPKFIFIGSIFLFISIAILGIIKKNSSNKRQVEGLPTVSGAEKSIADPSKMELEVEAQEAQIPTISIVKNGPNFKKSRPVDLADDFPNIDRIYQLFTTGPTKLPIVETITYATSVPWLKGRQAWLSDYASYFATSRHFISRSLRGKPDYFSQKISPGNRFNVFRRDKNFNFYLLVDVSRCKMGFYYIDLDTKQRILLKTYPVGLGKKEGDETSGKSSTPIGKFMLGNKIAVYKPKNTGYYKDQKVEMVQVYGTRWLPFKSDSGDSFSSLKKGLGIHGLPLIYNEEGQLVEQQDLLSDYKSDGSICMSLDDVEELFAIIITKPTVIEIVPDFKVANLPGTEVASPSRQE